METGCGVISLTARERDVLHRLSLGDTSREIAVRLGIREHTVRTHRKHLYLKMGAHRNSDAVRIGFERGILP